MSSDAFSTPQEAAASSTGNLLPLRVWPAAVLMVGMVIARWLPTLWQDGPANIWMSAAFGPLLLGLAILLWWLFASRASILERIVGFVGCIALFGITFVLVDRSMIGPALMVLTIPVGTAMFGIGAMLGAKRLTFSRTIVALLVAAVGFGSSALLRNEGMWGDFAMELDWRWNQSAEEQMLAARGDVEQVSINEVNSELDTTLAEPEWSGFRGGDRTSRAKGTRLITDWSSNPPTELWRIPVGPGWSSFAVAGNLLFTQEQRGPMESIVCYDADTGREIWVCELESRFDEAIGGPGPRATPTLANGQLYAMGAEGFLVRLDPKTGDIQWKVDLRQVAGREPPMWGFASSPLIVNSTVIVHAGGGGDLGVIGFDVDSGKKVWSVPSGGHSYSSPQLATVSGRRTVIVPTDAGATFVNPENGHVQLEYNWKHGGYRALQPQVVAGDSVLIPTGMGTGTRRIRLEIDGEGFRAEELWTSRELKPDYNDFVIYQGHIYGYDGMIFTCIDLETGERKWKGGRYGKGQVLLVEDSGLLLIASEKGEAVLLKADSTKKEELARISAIDGKTWNHPVLVGDRLFIRNGEEGACYRLPTK